MTSERDEERTRALMMVEAAYDRGRKDERDGAGHRIACLPPFMIARHIVDNVLGSTPPRDEPAGDAVRAMLVTLRDATQRFVDAVSDDNATCRDNGIDSAQAVEDEWQAIEAALSAASALLAAPLSPPVDAERERVRTWVERAEARLADTDDLSSLDKLRAEWLRENLAEVQAGARFVVMAAANARALKCGGVHIGNDDDRDPFDGWCVVDAASCEVVGHDGGEPEDQNLVRDWRWVASALNDVAAENRAHPRTAPREPLPVIDVCGRCAYCHQMRSDHDRGGVTVCSAYNDRNTDARSTPPSWCPLRSLSGGAR